MDLRLAGSGREILTGMLLDQVMRAALIPVDYTIGTDFRPAARHPLDTMAHWDRW